MSIKNHPAFAQLRNRIANKVAREVETAVQEITQELTNSIEGAMEDSMNVVDAMFQDTAAPQLEVIGEIPAKQEPQLVEAGQPLPLNAMLHHLKQA